MNKKGFTLAELLIVVAIIAVLVGIAIPVFTSQLEKSREGVDMANIRSKYGEMMTDVVTGEYKQKIEADSNAYTVTLKQKKPGWQSNNQENVSQDPFTVWATIENMPASQGSAVLSYDTEHEQVCLVYDGEAGTVPAYSYNGPVRESAHQSALDWLASKFGNGSYNIKGSWDSAYNNTDIKNLGKSLGNLTEDKETVTSWALIDSASHTYGGKNTAIKNVDTLYFVRTEVDINKVTAGEKVPVMSSHMENGQLVYKVGYVTVLNGDSGKTYNTLSSIKSNDDNTILRPNTQDNTRGSKETYDVNNLVVDSKGNAVTAETSSFMDAFSEYQEMLSQYEKDGGKGYSSK